MIHSQARRALLASFLGCWLVLQPALGASRGPDDESPTREQGLPSEGAEDVAHVPALDLFAKKNPRKRFVLIGYDEDAKVPRKGFGLIVILPGGTGAIDFHGFCKRIHDKAVPGGFLTVQLVSPAWTEWSAENLVWPTEKSHYAQAEFSTEEHLADAVAEVRKLVKIDKRRIYALAWSSGGPALYASSLTKKTPLTGCFIAMSIFHPDKLPPLSRAKGQRYYLLHSPEDFIPIAQAEEARDQLAKHKAETILVTYEGGHGWRGDVFGMLRAGFTWLQEPKKKR